MPAVLVIVGVGWRTTGTVSGVAAVPVLPLTGKPFGRVMPPSPGIIITPYPAELHQGHRGAVFDNDGRAAAIAVIEIGVVGIRSAA